MLLMLREDATDLTIFGQPHAVTQLLGPLAENRVSICILDIVNQVTELQPQR